MIIDAYSLVGAIPIRRSPVDFPQLFGEMESTGVNHVMVASLRGLHADARKGNEYLFASALNESRILPVGVVAPFAGSNDIETLIEDSIKNKAVALAFHVDPSISFSSLVGTDSALITGRPSVAFTDIDPGLGSVR